MKSVLYFYFRNFKTYGEGSYVFYCTKFRIFFYNRYEIPFSFQHTVTVEACIEKRAGFHVQGHYYFPIFSGTETCL